jgi:peptide/nickel transport system substrate-binding protein
MLDNRPTSATLEAVATSWRPAPAARLEIIKSNDPSARRGALLSGRADLAIGGVIGKDDIGEIEAAGFHVFVETVPAVVAMAFDTVRETPFRDIRVREAVVLAVDRAAIVDIFLGGYSAIASQPARRAAFGYNAAVRPLPHDPTRAKQLLIAAGYPRGFSFDMEMPGGTVIYANVFQKVAEDLARIGVRMVLRSAPPQLFLSNIQTGAWRGAAMAIPFYSPVNDALYPMRQHSCLWHAPWHCDPVAADMILDAGREPDLDLRRAKTERVMARAADQRQAMFLYETIQFGAHANNMSNVVSDLGFIHYEGITFR